MKRGIFLKILLALIITGMIPVLLFFVSTWGNYQEIYKYIAPLETIQPELAEDINIILNSTRTQLGLTLLLTVIIIIFIGLIFGRNITSPIRKLTRGIEEIARGNLDVKLKIKTGDELEKLTDAFNKMIREIKIKTEALEEEKSSLDVKVRARTQALEEERAFLEERVKERTKELQERIGELERFHKFTVGRELKMVELKQEIDKLKKELKKVKK